MGSLNDLKRTVQFKERDAGFQSDVCLPPRARKKKKNWEEQLKDLNVEESWQHLTAVINEAKKCYIPKTNSSTGDRKKGLDGGTLSAVQKKHKMYRRWIETREKQHYQLGVYKGKK